MSVILGLNLAHAGSSAALLVEGVPVAAMAEERLNRQKNYGGFPRQSIAECLRMAGIQLEDVDAVAIGRDSSANRFKKLEYVLRNPTKLLNFARIKRQKESLDSLTDLICREMDTDTQKVKFIEHNVEHHLAHAASAFYPSGWESAAGMTVDGSGDFVSTMLLEGNGLDLKINKRVYVPDSMGSLYTMICDFIGYRKYGDEGKVMGLAPLGEDTYRDVFEDMVDSCGDAFKLNSKYFMPFGSNQGMTVSEDGVVELARHFSDDMVRIFGEPRVPHSGIEKRDMDLAFGVQRLFQDLYLRMLNVLHSKISTNRVFLAGGCALNSVANGMIFENTPFEETWIQPASSDDGLALGAALHVYHGVLRKPRAYVMRDSYLGPSYSDNQIQAELEAAGVAYEKLHPEELVERTAKRIASGDVIGWFQGRMEWGPRALGNRSILAHPGLPNMKEILNARIKYREPFRPFAPAVLSERQADIFEQSHPSPFMLHVYKIKREWRDRLAAVNHVDNTGRLQSVKRSENSIYYDLIKRFGELTGIPVILNTSFNENEPIVCRPKEAIDCFQRTKMDVLAIGDFFCQRPQSDAQCE